MKVLLLFVLLGPVIGGMPMAFLGAALMGAGVGLVVIVFSYLFGLVPAAMAGVFFVVGIRLFPSVMQHEPMLRGFCFGLVAGFLGVISILLPALVLGTESTKELASGSFGWTMVLFGSFSGGVCGVLAARIRAPKSPLKVLAEAEISPQHETSAK